MFSVLLSSSWALWLRVLSINLDPHRLPKETSYWHSFLHFATFRLNGLEGTTSLSQNWTFSLSTGWPSSIVTIYIYLYILHLHYSRQKKEKLTCVLSLSLFLSSSHIHYRESSDFSHLIYSNENNLNYILK